MSFTGKSEETELATGRKLGGHLGKGPRAQSAFRWVFMGIPHFLSLAPFLGKSRQGGFGCGISVTSLFFPASPPRDKTRHQGFCLSEKQMTPSV